MAEGSEKQTASIRDTCLSASGGSAFDLHRAGTADVVLEQLEDDRVANPECVERGALTQVAAVEEDVAAVREPDVAMPLANQERDDPARARPATAFHGSAHRTFASRRCLPDSASRVLAHPVYQRGSDRR
jgi:hypothetical protein